MRRAWRAGGPQSRVRTPTHEGHGLRREEGPRRYDLHRLKQAVEELAQHVAMPQLQNVAHQLSSTYLLVSHLSLQVSFLRQFYRTRHSELSFGCVSEQASYTTSWDSIERNHGVEHRYRQCGVGQGDKEWKQAGRGEWVS